MNRRGFFAMLAGAIPSVRGARGISEQDRQLQLMRDLTRVNAQHIETYKLTREDIARICNVPAHRVGLLDRDHHQDRSLSTLAEGFSKHYRYWCDSVQKFPALPLSPETDTIGVFTSPELHSSSAVPERPIVKWKIAPDVDPVAQIPRAASQLPMKWKTTSFLAGFSVGIAVAFALLALVWAERKAA